MQAACDQYSKAAGWRGMPVGALDPLPRHRPEPGVSDELMGAGQHADGVQLHRPEPVQHRRHAAAAGGGAQEPLRAQGEQPRFGGRYGQLGDW